MLGTIAPPVGDRDAVSANRRRRQADIGLYSVATITAAALLGSLLGMLGSGLPMTTPWQVWKALSIGVLSLLYALHELRIVTLPMPQRKRQVPADWRYRFPASVTAVLFGALLGTGYATFIVVTTLYVLTMATVFSGSALMGAILFGVFGLGRAGFLWPISWRMQSMEQVEYNSSIIFRTKPLVHVVNGILLAFIGAVYIARVFWFKM